jgi:hypothetical protein
MSEVEQELIADIERRISLWESGSPEFTYAQQHHKLSAELRGLLRVEMKQFDDLTALEPRGAYTQNAIDQTAAVIDHLFKLGERISNLTEDANARGMERLSGADDWRQIKGFSEGWIIPQPLPDGKTQAIKIYCCGCQMVHWHEMRVHNGLIEYRVYGMENDDAEISESAGDGSAAAPRKNAAASAGAPA